MDIYQLLSVLSIILSGISLVTVLVLLLDSTVVCKALTWFMRARKVGRYRKRYLAIMYYPPGRFKETGELEKALRTVVMRSFGVVYLAGIDPKVVYFDPGGSKAIVKFNGRFKVEFLASLVASSELGFKVIPVGISGTFKSAKKKLS
ncbi:Rpp14/Pop5 family protein [Thermogladius sp.]|uniref:Rpp14/Pop5 family protein n=1 Tax=Thermogladius sp. TaxID=2023064 RepID=UPI003D14334B